VTDGEMLDIVVNVLGNVRDEIKTALETDFQTKCFSLKPEEKFLLAEKIHWQKGAEIIDLGYVGQIIKLETGYFKKHLAEGVIVIAPVGISEEGQFYNINGDTASSFISQAMGAEKLIFLTSVPGVMRNISNPDTLISVLTIEQAENLLKENIIHQGMIPKVKACIASLKEGVKKTHIISGNIPHSMLIEIFTQEGIGTEIVVSEQNG
jgi:acetylglutamate kinase